MGWCIASARTIPSRAVVLSPTSLRKHGPDGKHDASTSSRQLQSPWISLCITEDGQQPHWYDYFIRSVFFDASYTKCTNSSCLLSTLPALTSYATSISGSPVYLHGHTAVGTPSFSRQHFSPHPWSASTSGTHFFKFPTAPR